MLTLLALAILAATAAPVIMRCYTGSCGGKSYFRDVDELGSSIDARTVARFGASPQSLGVAAFRALPSLRDATTLHSEMTPRLLDSYAVCFAWRSRHAFGVR